MKRQLDRLKGKRLVTGDPNLMTKDEICINATPNGVEVKEIGTDGKIKDLAGSGDSGGDDKECYYIVDWEGVYSAVQDSSMLELFMICFSEAIATQDFTYKKYVKMPINKVYYSHDAALNSVSRIKALSSTNSIPTYLYLSDLGATAYIYGNIFERFFSLLSLAFNLTEVPPEALEELNTIIDVYKSYTTEISKEQYETMMEVPHIILGK